MAGLPTSGAALSDKDLLEQIDGHLASPCLSWLLGAGVSFSAKIPLMYPLTERVLKILTDRSSASLALVESIKVELPDICHVEHLLSQLGDYSALAARSKAGVAMIDGKAVSRAELDHAHRELVNAIAETVRWGFRHSPEEIGTPGKSIVEIDEHREFIDVCFRTARAGLHERRGPLRFFTTNYDTLLEDALALACVPYWDGFEGGAVAFRSHRLGSTEPPPGVPAHVVKLHGSIDWHLGEHDGRVWRVRVGDRYPPEGPQVLIHPQSTKYLAAQRDPFAAQFDLFRRVLAGSNDNVLAVCGYSFGDDHINEEIELAMSRQSSKTTLLAFAFEQGTDGMPASLNKWRSEPWGKRVYVATQRGLYVGPNGPHFEGTIEDLSWWTFKGVSKVLRDGAGSFFP
jgi:hypothetical protein